ncbi:MAG: 16S rRNA (guanine(527)-N(7))-methyltransferase RsmG [Pseudomonadales bacterium]|nr:16S rRNA (guanine(527)-N(7))-methyltransferase RsmG [Pseudomonadales bacterium]
MISREESLARIQSGLADIGIGFSAGMSQQLNDFLHRLATWNSKFNLTAVRDVAEMIPLHLLDSLAVADHITGDTVIDVGSGGGLPGIPLAILFPDKQFTLLDSNGKKTRFLEQMRIELALTNVRVVHERVEKYQGSYDHVICRAFTELGNLVSLTSHLLNHHGTILAMKGKLNETLPAGEYQVQTLKISVPTLMAERHLIIIKKNKHEG